MRYRAFDTNLLVMLDLLLDTMSITRTAHALGLTQPAVSAGLARLRDHFGDELLIQVGRTNVATPLAERLRVQLKELLARTDSVISQRAGFDPSRDKRVFSFIGSDYVATTLGADILRAVASAGPHLCVQLETLDLRTIENFDRAKVDVVILPSHAAYADHPTTELLEEKFVCAVADDHPDIGDTISAEQYLAARHVVHHDNEGRRLPILDQWFLDRAAIARDVAVRVPSFTQVLTVLPGTPFVATIQSRLAARMADLLPIRILPAPFDFPPLPIVMQWQPHLDADEGLRWFRRKVIEVVSRLERPRIASSGNDARHD